MIYEMISNNVVGRFDIPVVDFERLIGGKRHKCGFHFGHQPFEEKKQCLISGDHLNPGQLGVTIMVSKIDYLF